MSISPINGSLLIPQAVKTAAMSCLPRMVGCHPRTFSIRYPCPINHWCLHRWLLALSLVLRLQACRRAGCSPTQENLLLRLVLVSTKWADRSYVHLLNEEFDLLLFTLKGDDILHTVWRCSMNYFSPHPPSPKKRIKCNGARKRVERGKDGEVK